MDGMTDAINNLSKDTELTMQKIRDSSVELFKMYEMVSSREMYLAITNLEQSLMWATRAMVLNDIKIKELN